MKGMKGSGKHLSDNSLGTPNEIKTWEMLVALIRQENGVMISQENGAMILTHQHILLLHVGMRNMIKT
jgi:hypothetical protein